jgi:hypothetical protein
MRLLDTSFSNVSFILDVLGIHECSCCILNTPYVRDTVLYVRAVSGTQIIHAFELNFLCPRYEMYPFIVYSMDTVLDVLYPGYTMSI